MLTVVILWIVALAFIFVTLKNILVRAFKTWRCTSAVRAIITDVHEKSRTQRSDKNAPKITTFEYIPTVSYMVDGVEYSKRYIKAYTADTYAVGQMLDIMVNPNMPDEINKTGMSYKVDLVMLSIGIVIGIVGAVLLRYQ